MSTEEFADKIYGECRHPLLIQRRVLDSARGRLLDLCMMGDMVTVRREAWKMAQKLRASARAIEEVAEALEHV